MKLALIDDHPLLTQTLKNMFEKYDGFDEVRTYNSAALFLEDALSFDPEIAILDILMPGMNGIQLLEHVRTMDIKTKFIMLTSNSDAPIVKQAFDNGAMAFLSKASLFEEITEAIKSVLKGEQYIANDLQHYLLRSLVMEGQETNIALTPREKDVLTRVCKGSTLKQIAEELNLSTNTVNYYHKNVMSKMKVRKTADLVVSAIQQGYFIPESGRRM